MPAPPSRAQTDAKNAAVSSRSKSGGYTSAQFDSNKTSPSRSSVDTSRKGGNTGSTKSNPSTKNPGGGGRDTTQPSSTSPRSYGDIARDLDARTRAVSRGPGAVGGVLPGAGPLAQQRATQTFANALTDAGIKATNAQLRDMVRTVSGEAQGEGQLGQSAAANTMLNRLALGKKDPSRYSYLGAGDIDSMLSGYDAYGKRDSLKPNEAYKNTDYGTDTYGEALTSIADAFSPTGTFNKTVPDKIKFSTHYLTPEAQRKQSTRKPGPANWSNDPSNPFTQLGGHLFGNAEEDTAEKVLDLREQSWTPSASGAVISPASYTQPNFSLSGETGVKPTLAGPSSLFNIPETLAKGFKAARNIQIPDLSTAGSYVKQFADAQTGFGSSITGPIANAIVASKSRDAIKKGTEWLGSVQNDFNNLGKVESAGVTEEPSIPSRVANSLVSTVKSHPVAKGVAKTMDILDNALGEILGPTTQVRPDFDGENDFQGWSTKRNGSQTKNKKKKKEPVVPAVADNEQMVQNQAALFGTSSTPMDWYSREREKLAQEMRAMGVPF